MKTYQYRNIIHDLTTSELIIDFSKCAPSHLLGDLFNRLGENGWELVGVCPIMSSTVLGPGDIPKPTGSFTSKVFYWFKRPEDENDDDDEHLWLE